MDPFTLIGLATGGASLLGGLLGRSGANRAAGAQSAAIAAGGQAFDAQATRAEDAVNTGTDRATGYVQPYVTGGREIGRAHV